MDTGEGVFEGKMGKNMKEEDQEECRVSVGEEQVLCRWELGMGEEGMVNNVLFE